MRKVTISVIAALALPMGGCATMSHDAYIASLANGPTEGAMDKCATGMGTIDLDCARAVREASLVPHYTLRDAFMDALTEWVDEPIVPSTFGSVRVRWHDSTGSHHQTYHVKACC